MSIRRMTPGAYRAWGRIQEKMGEQGYATYAKMFSLFDLVILDKDDDAIAYMEPGKGRISVHPDLDMDQICVIIRHEILHEFLTHEIRLLKQVAKDKGLDWDKLSEADIDDLKDIVYEDDSFNIAGDYEISNLGYTEEDKEIIRSIKKGAETLSGLVTEDDHPDWVNLSLEEMYEKLKKDASIIKKKPLFGKNPQKKPKGPIAKPEEAENKPEPKKPMPPMPPLPPMPPQFPTQYHWGRFVDGQTFNDEDGNPYDPSAVLAETEAAEAEWNADIARQMAEQEGEK